MADLLECLVQVKGLRETADRVSALAAAFEAARWQAPPSDGGSPAADLLARLAEIEIVHGTWLRLMLASPRPALPAFDDTAVHERANRLSSSLRDALDRFLARRRENLALLERCSASDFSRVGLHPVRREITVADLVAVMMASDAERVGEIRRALKSG